MAAVPSSSALKLLSTQTFPTRTSFGPHLGSGLYFRCGEKHRGSAGCASRACWLVSNTQDGPHHQVRKVEEGGEALTCSQLLPFLQRWWRRQSARSPPSRLRPDLWESGSGLTVPWHGQETPLQVFPLLPPATGRTPYRNRIPAAMCPQLSGSRPAFTMRVPSSSGHWVSARCPFLRYKACPRCGGEIHPECPSVLGRDGEMNASSKPVNLLLLFLACGRTLFPAGSPPRLEVYSGQPAQETRRPLPRLLARLAAQSPARRKTTKAKAAGLGRHARGAPRPNSRAARLPQCGGTGAVHGCAAERCSTEPARVSGEAPAASPRESPQEAHGRCTADEDVPSVQQ
ncbi:uncharacterized protein LOC130265363 [Oenanthe melanoleuca]|uniref:uncharacterized protein LOC130265363 n=1 Tax=Oenanthe melanoleuca TaxID=2939378 RepID=UPI0024C1DA7B|nr:uncharacterized protein LOC130265363 [Oenanthe melanoleuca]